MIENIEKCVCLGDKNNCTKPTNTEDQCVKIDIKTGKKVGLYTGNVPWGRFSQCDEIITEISEGKCGSNIRCSDTEMLDIVGVPPLIIVPEQPTYELSFKLNHDQFLTYSLDKNTFNFNVDTTLSEGFPVMVFVPGLYTITSYTLGKSYTSLNPYPLIYFTTDDDSVLFYIKPTETPSDKSVTFDSNITTSMNKTSNIRISYAHTIPTFDTIGITFTFTPNKYNTNKQIINKQISPNTSYCVPENGEACYDSVNKKPIPCNPPNPTQNCCPGLVSMYNNDKFTYVKL